MNIGIFFSRPHPHPFDHGDYYEGYSNFAQAMNDAGMECYVVRNYIQYEGNGVYESAWKYQNNEFIEVGRTKIDLIYNQSIILFPYTDVIVFNDPYIEEICGDKWKMYKQFPHLFSKSWLIESEEQFKEVIEMNKGKLLVQKPLNGNQGRGVSVAQAETLKSMNFPFLLQEFLDSSGGVPGIVEGTHDFRIALLDGEIVYSYYRTPPTGSLLANVARGGTFEVVPVEKIPNIFLPVVKEVDAHMSGIKHRFYGIDLALTQQGPKIIEMNSRMGVLPNKDHPVFAELKRKQAALFKLLIQENSK